MVDERLLNTLIVADVVLKLATDTHTEPIFDAVPLELSVASTVGFEEKPFDE